MKTSLVLLLIGFVVLSAPPTSCEADLYINQYSPPRHDRFYQGADKSFIGEGYDFSGVGHTSSYRWVTMISPTFFVTATHHLPPVGSTVTFYEGNVKSAEFRHDYVVDDFFVTFHWDGVPSDLTLGRLVVPDFQREAILPEHNIAYYPIIPPEEYRYLGADVFVYGKPDIVGMNDIANMYAWYDKWTAPYDKNTYVARYTYNTDALGKGTDEAFVVTGDSGAPSFIVWEGRLALAGTHYFISAHPPPINGTSFFGDSFVPKYLDQMRAVRIEGDLNGDHFVGSEDLNLVRLNWNTTVPPGDFSQGDISGDGFVGSADLNLVRAYWGRTGPGYYLDSGRTSSSSAETRAGTAVPEPSFLALLFAATLLLGGPKRPRRRSRQ